MQTYTGVTSDFLLKKQMQTYTEMSKLYATKAKQYTVAQCRTAIVDIDATLKLQGDFVVMNDYVIKLFCERDAMLDRILSLR